MKNIKFLFILFIILIPFSVNAREFKVQSGHIDFVMDAPLEKIRGKTDAISGYVMVDESNFKTLTGSITIDLSKIVTYTFANDEKNKTQNEHLFNWFEIGEEVNSKLRKKYNTATLNIHGAKSVQKKSQNVSVLNIEADLTLHGTTKKVPLILSVERTDKGLMAKSVQPIIVGLQDYEIQPRDMAGRFLLKTLKLLDQRVAKEAQVSVAIQLQ